VRVRVRMRSEIQMMREESHARTPTM
jgi:hypothetical protein